MPNNHKRIDEADFQGEINSISPQRTAKRNILLVKLNIVCPEHTIISSITDLIYFVQIQDPSEGTTKVCPFFPCLKMHINTNKTTYNRSNNEPNNSI